MRSVVVFLFLIVASYAPCIAIFEGCIVRDCALELARRLGGCSIAALAAANVVLRCRVLVHVQVRLGPGAATLETRSRLRLVVRRWLGTPLPCTTTAAGVARSCALLLLGRHG